MLLKDMKKGMEVWCIHPDKSGYYLGIVKNIGHRPRVELNQRGQHGQSIFPYALNVYPKEAFTWCDECDGEGWVNYSCCGDNMIGRDIDICPTCKENWPADHEDECDVCEGKGVIKTNLKTETL